MLIELRSDEVLEVQDYCDLRNFLALDLTMRNGKRAGVLANLTLADIRVSPYWYS